MTLKKNSTYQREKDRIRDLKKELKALLANPNSEQILDGRLDMLDQLPTLHLLVAISIYFTNCPLTSDGDKEDPSYIYGLTENQLSEIVLSTLDDFSPTEQKEFARIASSWASISGAFLSGLSHEHQKDRELEPLFLVMKTPSSHLGYVIAIKCINLIVTRAIIHGDTSIYNAIGILIKNNSKSLTTSQRLSALISSWKPLIESNIGVTVSKEQIKTFLHMIDNSTGSESETTWRKAFKQLGWTEGDGKGSRDNFKVIQFGNKVARLCSSIPKDGHALGNFE